MGQPELEPGWVESRNVRVVALVVEFTNRRLGSGDQLVIAALNRTDTLVRGFDCFGRLKTMSQRRLS